MADIRRLITATEALKDDQVRITCEKLQLFKPLWRQSIRNVYYARQA